MRKGEEEISARLRDAANRFGYEVHWSSKEKVFYVCDPNTHQRVFRVERERKYGRNRPHVEAVEFLLTDTVGRKEYEERFQGLAGALINA